VLAQSIVLVCVFALHHLERYYPAPEEFRIERFLPEAKDAPPSAAFLPFSAGRRRCVGEGIALTEEVVIIAEILRQFSLQPAYSRLGIDQRATLRPADGLPLLLVPRAK
jgi:cytochrome P450